ncbi:MAG: hypothetical protein KKF44_10165 [Nanoarchaeota archaeon]|nr:hypothetical protein [Nanoarchaeota archaeon]
MKPNNLFYLVLALILFSAIIGFFIYFNIYLVKVENIEMDLIVKNNVGININTDALHFGGAPPSGSAERGIDIKNDYSFPLLVTIKTSGELAPLVVVSKNNFLIQPGEKTEVMFFATVPKDYELGKYTGSIRIELKRPGLLALTS